MKISDFERSPFGDPRELDLGSLLEGLGLQFGHVGRTFGTRKRKMTVRGAVGRSARKLMEPQGSYILPTVGSYTENSGYLRACLNKNCMAEDSTQMSDAAVPDRASHFRTLVYHPWFSGRGFLLIQNREEELVIKSK